MAGTINYLYDPDQQVWVIMECDDASLVVKEGKVIRVRGEVLLTSSVLEYDIQLDEAIAGTVSLVEADVFPTLNAAVLEYELRLT